MHLKFGRELVLSKVRGKMSHQISPKKYFLNEILKNKSFLLEK